MSRALILLTGALRVNDNAAIARGCELLDDGAVTELLFAHVRDTCNWSNLRKYALQSALGELGSRLHVTVPHFEGSLPEVVPDLVRQLGITRVIGQASFVVSEYQQQQQLAAMVPCEFVDSAYAVAPGMVRTQQDKPYAVFTPFSKKWRQCLGADVAAVESGSALEEALASGAVVAVPDEVGGGGLEFDAAVLPELARENAAAIRESSGLERWEEFLAGELASYVESQQRPDLGGTSGLSAHLALGTIHPRTLIADLLPRLGASASADKFLSELAWREFYADKLWHRPETAHEDANEKFAGYRWHTSEEEKAAWRAGLTGYPIVDAGMRELAATGYMHNRVRMIVASFLVKDLHLRWQEGAAVFWELLLDADEASNQLNWQWCAGTGFDAAPFFRIFNPTRQGEKFDPHGRYVRRWIPELAHYTGKVHQLPEHPELRPEGYPAPLVDHAEERDEALRRWKEIK